MKIHQAEGRWLAPSRSDLTVDTRMGSLGAHAWPLTTILQAAEGLVRHPTIDNRATPEATGWRSLVSLVRQLMEDHR